MDQFRVRLLGRCLAIGAWVMVHGVVSYAQIWPRVCPAAAGLFNTDSVLFIKLYPPYDPVRLKMVSGNM